MSSTRQASFVRIVGMVLVATLGSVGLSHASDDTGSFNPAAAIDPNQVNAALGLVASTVQTLELPQGDPATFSTTITVDGQTWTLDLRKTSMRSDRFQVLVQFDDSGDLVPVEAPPIRTYRGQVREIPGARIRGSLHDGRLTALIATPEGTYTVQALADIGLDGGVAAHAVYRSADSIFPEGYTCGTTDAYVVAGAADANAGETTQPSGTGLEVCELGIDSDRDFYLDNGSNINATVNDVEDVMNIVELRYEAGTIGITYEITTIIVRTVVGPYTAGTAEGLLCQLKNLWNITTNPEFDIKSDTAHLFTGKNVGGIIGVAWVGVICNVTGFDPFCSPSGVLAYGVSWSTWSFNLNLRAALTAHELGHNWNAGHCDGNAQCNIMCSGIGGCSGNVTSFGPTATSQIVAFRNSRNCLDDLADPQTIPFFDDFEANSVNSDKWSYNNGGFHSVSAENEPSPTRSLNLDATGAMAYEDNEIRTNFILLLGQSDVTVSYHTQHRGVESAEELVVEYWEFTLEWVELNRITSDGVDQDEFEFHSQDLPSGAMHNEFRLRFRVEVNNVNDDWYIDDVLIASGVPPTITVHPQSVDVCEGGIAAMNITATGSDTLIYQWKKDTVDLPGETTNTLVFNPAGTGDAGVYTCLVSNDFGSDLSDPATLTVVTPEDCDDGDFCNGVEACVGLGICEAGDDACPGQMCDETNDLCVDCLGAIDCNDEVDCTVDDCVAGTCVSDPDDAACANGAFCDGVETCDEVFGCVTTGDPCPDQLCDEDSDTCVDCLQATDCNDGVDCTVDECDAGVCNSVPDDAGCDNGAFCDGVETCDAGLGCVTTGDPCPGQACDEENDGCVELGEMSCELSRSSAPPGESVDLELFLENVLDLRGYQGTIEITKTSGSGELTVTCPDGVFVDTLRPDWVFAGENAFGAPDCDDLRIAGAKLSGGITVGPPAYLGTYVLDVSETATEGTTFEIAIVPNPGSFLRDSGDLPIPFNIGPICTLTVTLCGVYGDVTQDGVTDLDDILCAIAGFSTFEDCPTGDIAPCGGNGIIDLDDILEVIAAFGGADDPCCP